MIQLRNNEQVVARLEKHWAVFLWPTVFSFAFIGIPWLIYTIARYNMDEIILTNQNFHVNVGVISKEAISTPLNKINNVSYEQGFLGRIFGYGTICVQSAAISGYSYIKNPAEIKNIIEEAMEAKEKIR